MEKSRLHLSRWLLAGAAALLLALACSVAALATGPAWLGFGSAFFVLLGFAFTAPAVTAAGARVVDGATRRAERLFPAVPMTLSRLAGQNLGRSLHRNAVIVAALMAAIAMTVGISVMIYAFRRTVEVWIDRAIVADIFMTPAANETLGSGALLSARTRRRAAPRAGDPRGRHRPGSRGEHPWRPRFHGGRGGRRPQPACFRRRPRRRKAGRVSPGGPRAGVRAFCASLPRPRRGPVAHPDARRQRHVHGKRRLL